jgi:hypothetical protein
MALRRVNGKSSCDTPATLDMDTAKIADHFAIRVNKAGLTDP